MQGNVFERRFYAWLVAKIVRQCRQRIVRRCDISTGGDDMNGNIGSGVSERPDRRSLTGGDGYDILMEQEKPGKTK